MVSGLKTTFSIDIGQTINTGHVGRDLAASVQYYRDRSVQVPETVTNWLALFQLPDSTQQHEVLLGTPSCVWKLTVGGRYSMRLPGSPMFTRAHEIGWLSKASHHRIW